MTANRTRQEQTGVEIGPTGILALRGVAPTLNNGDFVGTTEVDFELEPILRAVKAASGSDVAVVLLSAMTGIPTSDPRGSSDLVLSDSTDRKLFEKLLVASSARLAREPVQLQAAVDGETYGLSIQPLLDYSGRMIGGIIGAQNFSAAHREFQRNTFSFSSSPSAAS